MDIGYIVERLRKAHLFYFRCVKCALFDQAKEFGQVLREAADFIETRKYLEDNGRVLYLPCAIGTTLYYVVPDESVTWPDDPEYKIITIAFRPDLIDEFGKRAFLTRDEAEIARKKANKMEV